MLFPLKANGFSQKKVKKEFESFEGFLELFLWSFKNLREWLDKTKNKVQLRAIDGMADKAVGMLEETAEILKTPNFITQGLFSGNHNNTDEQQLWYLYFSISKDDVLGKILPSLRTISTCSAILSCCSSGTDSLVRFSRSSI